MSEYQKTFEGPISLQGRPDVKLRDDFDALIQSKGYPVYWDKFIPCPCKEKKTNAAKLTCRNCHGRGFVLIKRIQTTMFLQSMNQPTEYKDWSIERLGTVSVTTLSRDKVSYMDRIVLYEGESEFSQLIYPKVLENGTIVALLDYPPVSIENLYMYAGDNVSLTKIDIDKVTIGTEGEIFLTNIGVELFESLDPLYETSPTFTIRYKYLPSYHIIDISRDIIVSPVDLENKTVKRTQFPFHAIGRRSHLVLESGNLLGSISTQQNNVSTDSSVSTIFGIKNF